jgi:hypothetical protein
MYYVSVCLTEVDMRAVVLGVCVLTWYEETLERPRHRWVNNINMNIKEMAWEVYGLNSSVGIQVTVFTHISRITE